MPQEKKHSIPAPTSSILTRVIVQSVVMTVFIIVLFSSVSFIVSQTLLQNAIYTQLSSVVAASQNSISQMILAARTRTALLTSNVTVKRMLTQKVEERALQNLLLDLQRDERGVAGVEIYDANHTLLASVGEKIGLPSDMSSLASQRPILSKKTWQWYDTFSPVVGERSEKIGMIAVRYDASDFLTPAVALVSALGPTARLDVTVQKDGQIFLLRPATSQKDSFTLVLNPGDVFVQQLPAVAAMYGEAQFGRYQNEEGAHVLASAQQLQSFGWGMAVEIHRDSALREVRSLAKTYVLLGTLLVLLAVALAYLLASQLTSPLRQLTARVSLLRPGHWQLKKTIHTGDEVQVLDHVITDLGVRLQKVYDHQEEEIESRTSELKKQYAMDRAILDGISQGVITVDAKGIVIGVNPAAARLLEFDAASLVGKTGKAILDLRSHDGQPIKIAHPVEVCLSKKHATRSPANAHWNIMRKDETLLPILIAVSPLMQGNSIFGAIIVLQDFTEERRIDYLKSEFITLASHQLRTPLSAVRWFVELFREEDKNLTVTQHSYIDEMDSGLRRMAGLLTDLLNAARMDTEGPKPQMQPVDAAAFLREVAKDSEQVAKKYDLTSKLIVPKKKVVFQSDPTMLQIVLHNFVSNAMKYSRKKTTVTITAAVTDSHISISVADQGLGIPKADQARVFERFFRAKNIRQMYTDGNGLGLYITKEIVTRLGGTIGFKSEENVGTTFTVKFPLGKVKDKEKEVKE